MWSRAEASRGDDARALNFLKDRQHREAPNFYPADKHLELIYLQIFSLGDCVEKNNPTLPPFFSKSSTFLASLVPWGVEQELSWQLTVQDSKHRPDLRITGVRDSLRPRID